MILSSGYGQNLVDKYKSKMNHVSEPIEQNSMKAVSEIVEKKTASSMESDIRDIKSMKQGTFESTFSFEKRVNDKLKELKQKINFYGKNASKEFSAGTITMKSYNADQETMQLLFVWNQSINTLFPETKKWKTATLSISRTEAKRLFENQSTHYFHIYLGYVNKKISIEKMMLYDAYEFTPNLKKKAPEAIVVKHAQSTKKENWKKHNNSVKSSAKSCNYYYTNGTSLNVRERPSRYSQKMISLGKNRKVCILERSNDWAYIKGKGWILSRYLSKTKSKIQQKKKKKTASRDRSVWHCSARSIRASGWVERVGKENAKRGALKQCTMRLQTNQPCRIVNCYRL